MPILASAVLADARSQLNDPQSRIFGDAALMPHLIRAYTDLKDELETHGIPVTSEVSSIITIPANTLILSSSTLPALPTDLIQPIALLERRAGNTQDLFLPMTNKPWNPEDTQVDKLRFWDWREQAIHFIGATNDVEIKIRYVKDIPDLVDVNSPLQVTRSSKYLAAKTAEYAARFIGQNQTKAGLLQADANKALAKLLTRATRQKQGIPFKRRRFWRHRRTIAWPSR